MNNFSVTDVQLKLNRYNFQALFTVEGLQKLDDDFLSFLTVEDKILADALIHYRDLSQTNTPKEVSELVIACAPYVDAFIANLFNIQPASEQLRNDILAQDPVFEFKKHYVQLGAKRMQHKVPETVSFEYLHDWLQSSLKTHSLLDPQDLELSVARLGIKFLNDKDKYQADIDRLIQWCVRVQEFGQCVISGWQSFHLPQKRNYENLVPISRVPNDKYGRLEGLPETQRSRDGFGLTDNRMTQRQAQSEIHYCVYCHKTEGDFCSKGFPVKKNNPELGLKLNPAGDVLTGCPLEEKISEMHVAKKSGNSIGALAIVMIDNPMCAATGHRICNDCMKACIYQKQDPVNIPEVETRVLTDVLNLPWGVEIYDLLMRWNPLRRTQYLPKPYNGKKVLIMGMGPAGFTLSHHLLMEGCAVVGADGLKIEPLDPALLANPIHSFDDIKEPLDDRVMAGFGGVAEYGITVRWDKNFLKLIYISLARRQHFQVFGGVRFGGSITVESAWQMGFDHITVAVGAGLPRELLIPNSLAPGMRQANDFLMALQLTGAVKKSSLANLQVRLPAVVIGGGLTGVDTATEVQAYYITQVEKTHLRYQILKNAVGEESLRARFNQESLSILDEFLSHAELVLAERAAATMNNRAPNFTPLIREWGGVTIVYRKSMQESPAYQRNHEEIIKALEEGIYYAEGLEPKGVLLDDFGSANALVCRWRIQDEEGEWMFSSEEQTIPAKSIFVATGAKPNVAYAFEHKGTLEKRNMNYLSYEFIDEALQSAPIDGHIKSEKIGVFTNYCEDGKYVSFVGDTHPVFHGSVVKAIASAKRSYPEIMKALNPERSEDNNDYHDFEKSLSSLFATKVVGIENVDPEWLLLTIHAPLAAKQFSPGQFYRLQNFETASIEVDGTRLQTEAVAALGIQDESKPDQLQFLIKTSGASARVLNQLKLNDPIALMGPTGVKARIPDAPEVFYIAGDQMAIAYLMAVGPALRNAGCHIVFICQLKEGQAPFLQKIVENIASHVTWLSASDDIIESLIDERQVKIDDADNLIVIGPVALQKKIQTARSAELQHHLKQDIKCIASVYGPMQCMLKGVCAQCLQWQIDPKTGERTKAVYACSWQHQPMEIIDMDNVDERLGQNKMQETLSNLWLDYLLNK